MSSYLNLISQASKTKDMWIMVEIELFYPDVGSNIFWFSKNLKKIPEVEWNEA